MRHRHESEVIHRMTGERVASTAAHAMSSMILFSVSTHLMVFFKNLIQLITLESTIK